MVEKKGYEIKGECSRLPGDVFLLTNSQRAEQVKAIADKIQGLSIRQIAEPGDTYLFRDYRHPNGMRLSVQRNELLVLLDYDNSSKESRDRTVKEFARRLALANKTD